jgi:hypothetical protein
MDFTNEANRSDTYFSDRNLSTFEYMSMEYDKKKAYHHFSAIG